MQFIIQNAGLDSLSMYYISMYVEQLLEISYMGAIKGTIHKKNETIQYLLRVYISVV